MRVYYVEAKKFAQKRIQVAQNLVSALRAGPCGMMLLHPINIGLAFELCHISFTQKVTVRAKRMKSKEKVYDDTEAEADYIFGCLDMTRLLLQLAEVELSEYSVRDACSLLCALIDWAGSNEENMKLIHNLAYHPRVRPRTPLVFDPPRQDAGESILALASRQGRPQAVSETSRRSSRTSGSGVARRRAAGKAVPLLRRRAS